MDDLFVLNQNSNNFPWTEFSFKHRLLDDRRLTLPELARVAAGLPQSRIEYNLGDLAIGEAATDAPLNGLTPEQTVKSIESCKSWLVLKHPERHFSQYQDLLDSCLDRIIALLPDKLKHLHDRESYIFISSPNSVTPFHIDPEHNFLLQIRGTKTMNVWPAKDRRVLPDEAIEKTIYGSNVSRSIEYQDEFAERGKAVHLSPGLGIYVPVHAPHWVKNGPEVSISYSITFRSAWSVRNTELYTTNAILRNFGLSPRPVNDSDYSNTFKILFYKGYSKCNQLKKRLRPSKLGSL